MYKEIRWVCSLAICWVRHHRILLNFNRISKVFMPTLDCQIRALLNCIIVLDVIRKYPWSKCPSDLKCAQAVGSLGTCCFIVVMVNNRVCKSRGEHGAKRRDFPNLGSFHYRSQHNTKKSWAGFASCMAAAIVQTGRNVSFFRFPTHVIQRGRWERLCR